MRRRWITTLAALCVALHLMAPGQAHADQRPHPLDYSLKQYAFLLSVALLGGLVSWVAKVRKGQAQASNLMSLMGELATSAFAGLLAFWICEASGVSPLLTAGLVGIAGHMGTRAIAELEKFAERRLNPYGPPMPPPPTPTDEGQSRDAERSQ